MTTLSTAWLGGSSESAYGTQHQSGEALSDLIDRHFVGVFAGAPSDTQTLQTGWKCDGVNKRTTSNINPGESWRDFRERHKSEATAAIEDCPPID